MNLVVLVNRINYFRFFSSVIKEAVKRKHNVKIWILDDKLLRGGSKSNLYPKLENLPEICESLDICYLEEECLADRLLNDTDIDYVLSLHFPSYYVDASSLGLLSQKWAMLFTGPDTYFELVMNNANDLTAINNQISIFAYSDYWVDSGKQFIEKYYSEFNKLLGKFNMVNVGNTEFDGFNQIDDRTIRREYNIPENRGVFLYLPFPCAVRNDKSPWEKMFTNFLDVELYGETKITTKIKNIANRVVSFVQVMTDSNTRKSYVMGLNEKNIFKSIRKFCDNENLYLVVKPRQKFPVSRAILKNADLIVWDDENQQDPPVLKELLSVSSVCFSFFSYSVLSSAFTKVFYINTILPFEFFTSKMSKFWFSEKINSMFNYKGVSESWEIKDVIKKLPSTKLDDLIVDDIRWKEYANIYLGKSDYCSSNRVVSYLEDKLK